MFPYFVTLWDHGIQYVGTRFDDLIAMNRTDGHSTWLHVGGQP